MPHELTKIIDAFESNAKKIHDKHNKNQLRGLKILYHYTDASALEQIIETKKLVFTDYRNLNDSSELVYAKNLILKTIQKSRIKFKNELEDIFNLVCAKALDGSSLNVYISCFSNEYDNFALWRFYGDDGCGFAIGFDEAFNMEEDDLPQEEKPTILKVIYDQSNFITLIKEFLSKAQQSYNRSIRYIKSSQYKKEEVIKEISKAIIAQLLPLLPCVKHSSFKLEKEYRLYLIDGSLVSVTDKTPNGFHFPEDRKKTISPENNSIQTTLNGSLFIKSPMYTQKTYVTSKRISRDTIKEIWIGPRCDFEVTQREIIDILKTHNYDICNIKIQQVDSPYRG